MVRAAQQGEPDAVERLYRVHYAGVALHVRRLVGSDPEADDLVQETFVAALGALRRFRGEARVSTWLHSLTVRTVRRHWRRRRFRRERGHDYAASVRAAEEGRDAAGSLEARDEARRIYAALERLSPKLREAFVLRHIEDLELPEAAAVAGVRPGTLAVRCHRAVEQLQRLGFEADLEA